MKQNGLKLNVVGIADINKAIFNRDGIDLEQLPGNCFTTKASTRRRNC